MYQMDTDRFLVCIKTDDICKDFQEGVETRLDTPNYELDRPLPKGSNKKVIGFKKDELDGKNYQICWIKGKNIYFIDDDSEDKKSNKQRFVTRIKRKFKNYKNFL